MDSYRFLCLQLLLVCCLSVVSASAVGTSFARYWDVHFANIKEGRYHAGHWHRVSKSALQYRFGHYSGALLGVQLYVPPVVLTDRRPLSFFLVHGTWARYAPEVCDETNRVFQDIKDFVQQLAVRERTPIELISINWNGGEDFESRKVASEVLGMLLNLYYGPRNGYRNAYIWAHSHGCNVVNLALHDIYFSVDTLLYFASPIVETTERTYRPLNFYTLYNFYSTGDFAQYIGALDKRSPAKLLASSQEARMYQPQKGRRVINMRIQFDATSPGHVRLKHVMSHLSHVLDIVARQYVYHYDLEVGVRCCKPCHYGKCPPPFIAIRSPLPLEVALRHIAAASYSARVARQIDVELSYSEKQKQAFYLSYGGRDIHECSSLVGRIIENILEVQAIIDENFPFLQNTGSYSLLYPVVNY